MWFVLGVQKGGGRDLDIQSVRRLVADPGRIEDETRYKRGNVTRTGPLEIEKDYKKLVNVDCIPCNVFRPTGQPVLVPKTRFTGSKS